MEDKMYEMQPVGFIRSCFKYKNGTPRQPGICTASQASLTIRKEIYNNPEHSLLGLEQFSHVWVLFIFHKNNNTYDKAKVKPPRLNGAKVGVFSTRSPYRLNPIGLTLAKIEKIAGDTLYLSGVDMLDGTPVIDIKPYICTYDQPVSYDSASMNEVSPFNEDDYSASSEGVMESTDTTRLLKNEGINDLVPEDKNFLERRTPYTSLTCQNVNSSVNNSSVVETNEDFNAANVAIVDVLEPYSVASCGRVERDAQGNKLRNSNKDGSLVHKPENVASHLNGNLVEDCKEKSFKIDSDQPNSEILRTANWIAEPPIPKLKVRFTPSASSQLQNFSTAAEDENFKLRYISDAETAIKTILQADPRSTYRRTKCSDRLYFCAVDSMHVTAWFNDDENIAEVLRVKPAASVGL